MEKRILDFTASFPINRRPLVGFKKSGLPPTDSPTQTRQRPEIEIEIEIEKEKERLEMEKAIDRQMVLLRHLQPSPAVQPAILSVTILSDLDHVLIRVLFFQMPPLF